MNKFSFEQGPVQVRLDNGGLKYFDTLDAAYREASKDQDIVKISFSLGSERVILDR
jgi:hypothetical protein